MRNKTLVALATLLFVFAPIAASAQKYVVYSVVGKAYFAVKISAV